jgi:hypothetical protein
LFAAERKSDGKLVGHVGLFDYHREIAKATRGRPAMRFSDGLTEPWMRTRQSRSSRLPTSLR